VSRFKFRKPHFTVKDRGRQSILTLRGKIFSILSRELNARIPQFHPYDVDYEMIFFVYRDLVNWLRVKWDVEEAYSIPGMLDRYVEEKNEEFNALLSFWLDLWLQKWRDRVRILHKKPRIPKLSLEQTGKSIRIYRELDHREELKEALIRKLVNHGEICMTEQIAENLIVEEIAKYIPRLDEARKVGGLNPLEILNNLVPRVSRLSRERGPLVYLKMRNSLF